VTSDFPPKMLSPLINGFPDVRFYDYTKLATPRPIADNHHLTYSSDGVAQVVEGKTIGIGSNWNAMINRLNGGFNVAMAFTSKKDMPDFVLDEKTGEKFQVWNGDNYDARFLDPRPGQKENLFNKGMIIGLTNKDRTGRPEDAAIRYDGFFVDYDRDRDGDTVVIRDQEKIKQGKKVIPIAKPSLRAPQTEAFKRWFGDSKVVDESGEPLVVYHGTNSDFNVFSNDKLKSQTGNPTAMLGHFFSPNAGEASRYAKDFGGTEGGNVMPVYLRIQNPKRLTYKQMNDIAMSMFDSSAQDNAYRTEGGKQGIKAAKNRAAEMATALREQLISEGHDGAVVRIGGNDEWIAFFPEQIKSATGNIGTFDTTNPDIRYSLRDKLGMYSELENKIEVGSNKAPAASWKAYINGLTQKGVKPEEIEWSGVKDWLDLQKGMVTKEELLNYLKQGGVRVEETALAGSYYLNDDEAETIGERFWPAVSAAGLDINQIDYELRDGSLDISALPAGLRSDASLLLSDYRSRQTNLTKYGQYTLPGGENYREVLLTLPDDTKEMTFQDWVAGGMQGEWSSKGAGSSKRKFRSSHWDQPNVLAHIRVNDRTDADGKKVLFVEEIQSDWGQEGKKKGFDLSDAEKAKQKKEIDRLQIEIDAIRDAGVQV
jgi:hypothetical protein